MKLKVLFVSVLMALNLSAFDMDNLPTYSKVYDKEANAFKDLSSALEKAKKTDKKVLLIAGSDRCRWSGTLDNFLEDNENISKDFYTSFEVVRVYYGNGMNESAKSLLKQFPVLKGTPHFYLLDKDAKLLESIGTAYLERGYGYNKSKVKEFIKNKK